MNPLADAIRRASIANVSIAIIYVFSLSVIFSFGMFSVIGLELMQFIDKISLAEYFVFYVGYYTVTSLAVSLLTIYCLSGLVFLLRLALGIQIRIKPRFVTYTASAIAVLVFTNDLIGIDIAIGLTLPVLLMLGLCSWILGREFQITIALISGLALVHFVGAARVERETFIPATVSIKLKDTKEEVVGHVIIPAGRGIIVFNTARDKFVFIGYDSILSLEPTDSQTEKSRASRSQIRSIRNQVTEFYRDTWIPGVLTRIDELISQLRAQWNEWKRAPN
jgi:hypothetical protein